MTIEKQIRIKQKELHRLSLSKNRLIKTGQKKMEDVWRGEGRKDYDNLCEEINQLYEKIPKISFEELFGDEEDERYFSIKVGIINLDEIEMIMIEGETQLIGEDTIAKMKKFIQKYPDYCYSMPYEGDITYFFSKKPTIIKISNEVMLHRGACGQVKNCPKNALIIMDLD